MSNKTEIYDLDNAVIPPPIKRVIKSIDQTNVNIPGEIVVSEQGQLLKKYFEFEGFSGDLIDAYNNWVTKILPKQLASRNIKFPDGKTEARIVGVRYIRPTVGKNNNDKKKLYPLEATLRGLSYTAPIEVKMQLFSDDKLIEERSNIHIGSIPVMVRSILCNLHGLSDKELLDKGECITDPFGYFIIKGTARLILIQEKLRVNRIFLFNDVKGNVVCKFTSSVIGGTSVMWLSKDELKGSIIINMKYLGKGNNISVFQIYKILGMKIGIDINDQMILDLILLFTKPEWKKKIWFILQPTFVDLMTSGDPIKEISDKIGGLKKESYDEKRKIIVDNIDQQLFPQMTGEQPINKLYLLSIMVARYAEFLSGLTKLDDRDNWGNKKLETAGKSMEQLFNGLYNKFVDSIEKSLFEKSIETPTLESIKLSLPLSIIGAEFLGAFNANNWGVKGSYMKENITDVLKREGPLSMYSQVTRINTPTSRQAKQPHIRMVQMSQLGYIDPVETPEGNACGLVKQKSVTCYISIEHDELIIRSFINKYILSSPNISAMTVCILNGKFLGWCVGNELKSLLINLRRTSIDFKGLCIKLDNNNILWIYNDGSRPTRPLLIVDNNQLILRQKNLFGKSMDDLLSEGAVEYIDAFEQEDLMIAKSINDLDAQNNQLREAINIKESYEVKLSHLESINLNFDSREKLLQILPQKIKITTLDDTILLNEFNDENIELNENEHIELTTSLTDDMLFKFYYSTLDNLKQNLSNTINTINSINNKTKYTHCELDPNAILGIAASIIPLPDHNQAPRNVYQCSMGKQALGAYHSNHRLRFDTTMKTLAFPSRPLFETQMNKLLGLNQIPSGEMVICAIMTYGGFNQEDAIIVNRASLERGLFTIVVYRSYKSVQNKTRDIDEKFSKPKPRKGENPTKYDHLDERGIAKIGSYVKQGDVIIGKIRVNLSTQKAEYANTIVGIGEEGVVDRVLYTTNGEGHELVRVKIRQVRSPVVGDKFASRHAQKSTIGQILDEVDMPFTSNGIRPDIIINPHSIPSRMTIAKLIEIVTSKISALQGERVNATAFNNFNIDDFRRNLSHYGYNEYGNELLMSGYTGRPLQAQIFIGPCYYQALRHHVKDKIQFRSTGAVKAISRQPTGGRQRGGGLRFGEMERDALISHGASSVLKERLCISSDLYKSVFCKSCGTISISNIRDKQFICRTCQTSSFGLVEIPYAYKVLVNLLAGAGLKITHGLKDVNEIIED